MSGPRKGLRTAESIASHAGRTTKTTTYGEYPASRTEAEAEADRIRMVKLLIEKVPYWNLWIGTARSAKPIPDLQRLTLQALCYPGAGDLA